MTPPTCVPPRFAATVASLGVEDSLRGFATNVANYQPLGEPCPETTDCVTGDRSHACCDDPCGLLDQWNRGNTEHAYATLLVAAMEAAMPGFHPKVIIDTGRNGHPQGRTDCASWCNPRDMGVGVVPTHLTADPLVDAYYWLKTPGESDGCTQYLPDADDAFQADGECPRFDQGCASVDSLGTDADEPYCPEAGHWFDYQVKMLAEYADMD